MHASCVGPRCYHYYCTRLLLPSTISKQGASSGTTTTGRVSEAFRYFTAVQNRCGVALVTRLLYASTAHCRRDALPGINHCITKDAPSSGGVGGGGGFSSHNLRCDDKDAPEIAGCCDDEHAPEISLGAV